MITLDTSPINKDDFAAIKNEIKKYKWIDHYYLKFFENQWKKGNLTKEFPLVCNPLIMPGVPNEFLEEVNNLIGFHNDNKTKNLNVVMKESRNKTQFYHSLSQLECAKFFIEKGFGVEFGEDLILKKNGLIIYIEIKSFMDLEFMGLVINAVRFIKADYHLEIENGISTKAQVEKLKLEVEKRLKKPTDFDLNQPLELRMNQGLPVFATVKFHKKGEEHYHTNTGVIIKSKDCVTVDAEFNRCKIKEIIFEGNKQLNTGYKNFPKFILFDLKNSKQELGTFKDPSDFRTVIYGERTYIANIPNKEWKKNTIKEKKVKETDAFCNIKGFKEVCDIYLKSKSNDKIPLSYLSKRGLYFEQDYNFLNGIIVRTHKSNVLYLNPFVHKDILINEDLLKTMFNININ